MVAVVPSVSVRFLSMAKSMVTVPSASLFREATFSLPLSMRVNAPLLTISCAVPARSALPLLFSAPYSVPVPVRVPLLVMLTCPPP